MNLKPTLIVLALTIFTIGAIFLMGVANGEVILTQLTWQDLAKHLQLFVVAFGAFGAIVWAGVNRKRQNKLMARSRHGRDAVIQEHSRKLLYFGAFILMMWLVSLIKPTLVVHLEQILSQACITYHQQNGSFPANEKVLAKYSKVPKFLFKYNEVFPAESERCDLIVLSDLDYTSVSQESSDDEYLVVKQIMPLDALLRNN